MNTSQDKARIAKEARAMLEKTSITPGQSLTAGVILCSLLTVVIWLFVEHSFLNLLIIAVIVFFIVGYLGLKKVPVAKHAVITAFGMRQFAKEFRNEEKSILCEGLHWLIPFICDAIVIDTRERSIKVGPVKTIVLDPKDSTKGITVTFSDAQISYMPVGLFDILNTGETDIDNELIAVAQETMRDRSATLKVAEGHESPEAIFSENVNEAILSRIQAESDSERWGIVVLSAKTPKIEFADEKTRKAFEQQYVEDKQRHSEATQMQTVIDNAEKLKDQLGVSPEDALLGSQRSSGLLRPSDLHITRSGNGGGTDLGTDIIAAAALNSQKQDPEKPEGE
jgi:regulator of protease activity HflC (stomatin/prohibitin superfamily)